MNRKNAHSKWIQQMKVMIRSQFSISKGTVVPDKSLLFNESWDRLWVLLCVTHMIT